MTSLALALLTACGGTGDTGTGANTGSNTSTEAGHPNVPEGYEELWRYDEPCETSYGRDGIRAYTLAEGAIDASGNLSLTETWYWFFGEEDYAGDCVDVLTYQGSTSEAPPSVWGYGDAEEAYEPTIELAERGCDILYYSVFDAHKVETLDNQRFHGALVLDTTTPSGNPNEDNKMLAWLLVLDEDKNRWEGGGLTEYARGFYVPEGADIAPPSTLSWSTEQCLTPREG